jgi:hypothetical protein
MHGRKAVPSSFEGREALGGPEAFDVPPSLRRDIGALAAQ